jgi:hypothetical protein
MPSRLSSPFSFVFGVVGTRSLMADDEAVVARDEIDAIHRQSWS